MTQTDEQQPSEEAKQIARQFAEMEVARQAVMLEDLQKILEADRARARAHSAEMLDGDLPEEGEDVIHIGDTHLTQPKAETSAAIAASGSEAKVAQSAGLSTVAKLVLAGLLAGGSGGLGGLAGYLAAGLGASEAVQEVVEAGPDADTLYQLELVEEE